MNVKSNSSSNSSSKSSSNSSSHVQVEAQTQLPPARLYVGVDVAKADFAAATVWQAQASYLGKQPNTVEGCAAFVAQIGAAQQACGAAVVHLVIEPTGGLEAELVEAAHASSWLVTVVNLKHVHHWAQAQGQRAKTNLSGNLCVSG